MKNKILVFALTVLTLSPIYADEGMWIPLLLEQTRLQRMQELGFLLTSEDVYSVNQASLKDAVIWFDSRCSGVVVSESGLILTNHHCGYGQLQMHSTLENDILTYGFWANSMEEELPNPGTHVSFLKRMEDVTDLVFQNVNSEMHEQQRTDSINAAIARIRTSNLPAGSYRVEIRPLFRGNQYFMYVYEVFTDIRLVGAPPSSIGKFGGDVDNWMWPRHTGDFAFFRIYADQNNRPADYSPDNVPYRPKRHIQVTTNGAAEGDFTMVYGYPAVTNQYISSYELYYTAFQEFPARVAMRDKRLEIMDNHMQNDRNVAIQYATKHAGVANPWKRWQGVTRGIIRLDGIRIKQAHEEKFMYAVDSNPQWLQAYGQLLYQIKNTTEELTPLNMVSTYYSETVSAVELVGLAGRYNTLSNTDMSDRRIENFLQTAATFYRDYSKDLDRDMFVSMMKAYHEHVPNRYHFEEMNIRLRKHRGSFEQWANDVFKTSVFRSYESLHDALTNRTARNIRALENDPFLAIYRSGHAMLEELVTPMQTRLTHRTDSLGRIYMAAQMATDPERIFYPDANRTMRVTFGVVEGYMPVDAVKYMPYTTLEGIIEKDNPDVYHFNVPEPLRAAIEKGDFGRYAIYNQNTVPVCFLASNHTSGGNSGSPVLNHSGELLGLNFDRTWESTMSDFVYDVTICRNITVDIRYILFVTDKVYGANWIIDELNLKCDCE